MNIEILGQDINYETYGEGKDVILLHGWGTNIDTYNTIINSLKDGFKVTTLDFPGFGKSSDLKEPWFLSNYTELVYEFMLKLNIKKPIIMGHSHGGRVAIHLNSKKKIDINKIILVGSAGIKPKRKLNYYLKVYSFKTIKFFLTLPLLKSKTAGLINEARNLFGSSDYKSISGPLRQTMVNVVNVDLTNILSEIKVPTLLIWGENDNDTPLYQGKIMEKNIADSGLVVLKDTGHYSFIEKQYEFNAIINNFLEEDLTKNG